MIDPDNSQPAKPGSAAGEEDFAAMLAASETQQTRRKKIVAGDVVRGHVIALSASSAFVEIGGKGEAVINLDEFRDSQSGEVQLAVGDQVEATVTDDGGQSGQITLKRTVGRGGHVSGELDQALAGGIPVEGIVTGENKGGFDVQIGTVRAFCPGSQIDRRRGQAAQYIGQRLRFRIIKIEFGGRNVVVSRRALLDDEAAAQAITTWERLKVDAVVQGTVTSVRDFGAFVDLGGVEGLVHISELGHGRARHPSDVLTVGQAVEVKVLKVEPGDGGTRPKIGLSLRALAADPWGAAREQFAVGATVRGTVRRLENFGAFVEVAPGLDGLVHVSKMALDRRIAHPRQVVNIGDEIDVTIMAVDPEKRRLSLSMVEHARKEQDAGKVEARQEEQAAVAQANERKTLGTFADLLAVSKKG
ncbi:MAG: S1 RNA-binding domain-containing protein [Deltaproteobacteria bacterium]|nr:S1 RNA-binding domain-containing protein [Deltaproteobacteria bacterium]MBI3387430.1 S1 RNA-binding domain-containing protein [Deltaproteobacteria bacterium]